MKQINFQIKSKKIHLKGLKETFSIIQLGITVTLDLSRAN